MLVLLISFFEKIKINMILGYYYYWILSYKTTTTTPAKYLLIFILLFICLTFCKKGGLLNPACAK